MELSRAPLDRCDLEIKDCEDCEGQLVSDENDTKIRDAATHNLQEKGMDKATSARMKWLSASVIPFKATEGVFRNTPLQNVSFI